MDTRARGEVIASSVYQNLPTPPRAPEVQQRNPWMLTISSLRKGREQRVAKSSNRSKYLMKLLSSSCPEGNCGGNQLFDGSVCLSPQSPSVTDVWHVSIATSFHQSFP